MRSVAQVRVWSSAAGVAQVWVRCRSRLLGRFSALRSDTAVVGAPVLESVYGTVSCARGGAVDLWIQAHSAVDGRWTAKNRRRPPPAHSLVTRAWLHRVHSPDDDAPPFLVWIRKTPTRR
jgi:hypothetical protein